MGSYRASKQARRSMRPLTTRCCSPARTWRRSPTGRSRPTCSTTSPIRNSRRAQARRQAAIPRPLAQQEELTNVFGKLTWDAVPWSQPIPLVAGGVVILRRARCCPLGSSSEAICRICGTNGSPASITSASASGLSAARAADAARSPITPQAICRRSILIRSSRRTATGHRAAAIGAGADLRSDRGPPQ